MDWFAWLSQTQLQPSLVYNYGVLFACNELTLNDVAYFDHDFLLSMGVKIGKHRLEIIKLARSETRKFHSIKTVLKSVADAARSGIARCAKKFSCQRSKELDALSFGRKLSPLRVEWKEIREQEERYFGGCRFSRSPGSMASPGFKTANSGPIGRKRVMGSSPILGQRKYVSGPINGGRPFKAQSPRFSGPLEGTISFGKSPRLSGQMEGCYGPEPHSPWAMLFEDLRPN